jgi:hypothetical protein
MTAYSIHLEGQDECEAERFYEKYDHATAFTENMGVITGIINLMLDSGAREGRFRPEGLAHAIPTGNSALRLYCIRLNNNAVIFGNGGEKTSLKNKDSPDCNPHFECMKALARVIQRKLLEGELNYDKNNQLIETADNGFYFEFGNCE